MNSFRPWLWVVPLTLLWPGLFLAYLMPGLVSSALWSSGDIIDTLVSISESLPIRLAWASVFLPMGLVSALCLVVLWSRAETPSERRGIRLGYLLASPIAFFLALMSGLMLPPILGTLIYGALPLMGGTLGGYDLGKHSGEYRGAAADPAFHLRTLAWLWVVYSIMQGLFATAAFQFAEGSPGLGRIYGGVLLFLLAWLAVQFIGLAGGILAMRRRGWSVYLLLLAAILNLHLVPIGTLLSLYTLLYALWLIARRLIVRPQSS